MQLYLGGAAWGATQTTPRHLQNEGPCLQLRLVAQHRHRHWREGEDLPWLYKSVQHSADGIASAMVMAYMTLAESAYWLCQVSREIFLHGIDTNSKWLEIFAMTKTTTEKTISILRHLFSSCGFPEEIVSDNGPQLTSDQFADFLKQNGVRHTRSAPYHPATNGSAERMVQVLKNSLKLASRLHFDHQLANFLLSYQSVPHSTTGVPPAELFLKRWLRTRLTLLTPDQEADVHRK